MSPAMFEQLDNFSAIRRIKALGPFDIRPMFGGLCLYRRGEYFGAASEGRLFLRTFPQTEPDFIKLGAVPLNAEGRYKFSHTFAVPDSIAEDDGKLLEWTRTAMLLASEDAGRRLKKVQET